MTDHLGSGAVLSMQRPPAVPLAQGGAGLGAEALGRASGVGLVVGDVVQRPEPRGQVVSGWGKPGRWARLGGRAGQPAAGAPHRWARTFRGRRLTFSQELVRMQELHKKLHVQLRLPNVGAPDQLLRQRGQEGVGAQGLWQPGTGSELGGWRLHPAGTPSPQGRLP